MTDLHDLLDGASHAVDGRESRHDPAREIRLGRRALVRRRLAAAGGGVVAGGLVVGTIVGGAAMFSSPDRSTAPATSVAAAASTLVDVDLTINGFHVAKLPQGWQQGQQGRANALFVPVTGEGYSANPDNFAGKILVTCGWMLNEQGLREDPSGGGTLMVEEHVTVDGQPAALVTQIPASADLSHDEARAIAAAVDITGQPTCANG